jgi:hypothetical protein
LAGRPLDEVRRLRDAIERQVRALVVRESVEIARLRKAAD